MKKIYNSPILYLFLLAALCLNTRHVAAQQTKKISLQGFLKDANGKAVADGPQSIIFTLYPSATGGTAEWAEAQSINVFGGVYSTNIGGGTNTISGGVTDFGNLSWGSKTYFVGVTVQGTELTPRTELTFAPYSLGSPKAQEVVCSGAVGDVKYSVLNPTQFAAVNGDCWVAMDGRSITGSKLATILGVNTLASAGGMFLRGQDFSNSDNDPDRTSTTAIATFQDQAFANHNHSHNISASGNTSTNGAHTHDYDRTSDFDDRNDSGSDHDNPNRNESTKATTSAGNHNHTLNITIAGSISNNGGNETRPKNLNLWTYIRIN